MTPPLATSTHAAIRNAVSADDIEIARALFVEYAQSLGFSLCFQGFGAELRDLPGAYSLPRGCLLLASVAEAAAGCVAVRSFGAVDTDTCEMKRLYVRDAFRGLGLGRQLVLGAIQSAKSSGYARLRLDTLPTMVAANALYDALGFHEIEPYCENPLAGARYREVVLSGR